MIAAHRRIIFTRRNSSCNRMHLRSQLLCLLLLCGGGGLVAPISGTTTAFLVSSSQHQHRHAYSNHPTRTRRAAAAAVVPFLYTHTHTSTSTERRHSGSSIRHDRSHTSRGIPLFLAKRQSDSSNKNGVAAGATLKRVPPELEGIPIPFVAAPASSSSSSATESSSDGNTLRFIECYADCICTLDGEEYTIAVPCDYSVALCYYDGSGKQQLIPVEPADTATMDDLFPVAEAIVADEFGEELVLQRTPQTLTLVGELEDDDDEEEDDDDDEEEDGEEEVEVLLSFEHRGKEFLLVRLLDPILLVGKKPTKAILEGNDNNDDEEEEVTMDMRVLLTPDEADRVMPQLEDLFLKFHNDGFYDDDDEEEDDDDDYPDDITIVQAP